MNGSGDWTTWGRPSMRGVGFVGVQGPRVQADRVVGSDGQPLSDDGSDPMDLTHWSMGQFSTYADAPASYLRTLPPELAAACINQGLSRYHGEDVQLMTQRGDNGPTMRAMTTAYRVCGIRTSCGP